MKDRHVHSWAWALAALISTVALGGQPGLAASTPPAEATVQLSVLDRARDLTSWHVRDKISTLQIEPHWIGATDAFWYLREKGDEKAFFIVDARTGARRPAFDHARVLVALNRAAGAHETRLPFTAIRFLSGNGAIEFQFKEAVWGCDIAGSSCRRIGTDPAGDGISVAPDGRRAVRFVGNNLALTGLGTDAPRMLTHDGVDGDAYGRTYGGNANKVANLRHGIEGTPEVLWSADSRFILVERIDERGVGQMPLTKYLTGESDLHPQVYHYALGMPGDAKVARSTLYLIDTETGTAKPVTGSEQPLSLGTRANLGMIWWADARTAYFVVHDRPFKNATLKKLDAVTGAVSTVLSENSKTFLSLSQVVGHQFMTLGLSAKSIASTGEVLWFSERDGWGHLYLYDRSGRLERKLTSGHWLVHEIIHIDPVARQVYFTAGGREPDTNPYYARLYRINLDGSGLTLLTPETADHALIADSGPDSAWPGAQSFSPSGRYFVETYAGLDAAPVSVLRTAAGKIISRIDEPDISYLKSRVRVAPLAFSVKARDGKTDLYGAIFRPSDFDARKSYPVIDYIYPGPFDTWTPRSVMDLYVYCEAQALAELGFVVITMDALGSAGRSKAFMDVAYDNLQDAGLPDHVAALRQLAARYGWMDTRRVGMLGISSGGFASALALLKYPDTYSVAVSAAGIYDMRIGFAGWTERFQGLPESGSAPPQNYRPFVLATLADRLQGKLMIVMANLDENANPAVTFRFIDALTKAGKPYDLVLMVDRNHGFAQDPYYAQRYWTYFLENLQGKRVPSSFKLD